MFLSVILPLTALNAVERPVFYGREAHALFLDLVANTDSDLAAQLHSDQQRKPFTVSSLWNCDKSALTHPKVITGGAYRLRLTCISDRLSDLVLEAVLPKLPPTIRLGEAQFEVGKPICDAAVDDWAGQTTSDALMSKWFGASAPVTNRLELEFASPTAFKRQGLSFVQPTPALAFSSFLAAWNEFAAPAFDPKLLAIVESEMHVTRYHLRTQALQLRGANGEGKDVSNQIGFLGRCGFTIFSPDRALWRTLHLLADFAFFCGTGYKTTQGMGQTRRVERDEGREKRDESSKGD